MSDGVAVPRPVAHEGLRRVAVVVGVVGLVAATVPAGLGALFGGELGATVRFSMLAMVVPALLVVGAPGVQGWASATPVRGAVDRLAAGRRSRTEFGWSLAVLAVDVAVLVAWRTPLLVDAAARHVGLVVVESATLVAAGVALWLELIDCPPLVARSTRLRRGVLAALAMWSVWAVAYLEGMSHVGWYAAFRHASFGGLSTTANRQASAAVLWAVAAAVFMPVIFWNLFQWLRAEGATGDARDPHAVLGRRPSGAAQAG